MNYESKPAIQSLGVVGPAIAIFVIVLGMMGVDIANDVAGVPDRIAGIIDSGMALVGIAVGIYGRVTATKQISGLVKQEP